MFFPIYKTVKGPENVMKIRDSPDYYEVEKKLKKK